MSASRAEANRSTATRALLALVTAPIVLYQRFVSPAIPRRCKYEPTCSRYALDAVRRYGILRGLVLAGWRLLRCNPWSHGGYDPVEAQRVFRIGGARTPAPADEPAPGSDPAAANSRRPPGHSQSPSSTAAENS